jgi:hypothetical protein
VFFWKEKRDKNGTRRFQHERIATNTNREKQIHPVLLPILNPFLSVPIRSYPFKLEPFSSVGILCVPLEKSGIKTEPDGSSMNG